MCVCVYVYVYVYAGNSLGQGGKEVGDSGAGEKDLGSEGRK